MNEKSPIRTNQTDIVSILAKFEIFKTPINIL